jgi:hypothetical protein
MKDIVLGMIVAVFIFGLIIANKQLDVQLARDCNEIGGIYFDGICQRPAMLSLPRN